MKNALSHEVPVKKKTIDDTCSRVDCRHEKAHRSASVNRAKPTDCVNARHSLGWRRRAGAARGRVAATHAHMHPPVQLLSITNAPILNTRHANLASMC
ncbi:jg15669 [Pararge aegeria aegeria]|uniref:Jg15669 protein n=1 Tax=Pararge aegeria aegeria TaxID=348720 RepID=A0A8S4RUH2_9NEOP|nr:jg15669 [Pararge aegeria aegeria]